jgi:enamine deaminase RidA (YjgF/YER057c/UK114 family)
MDQPRQIVSSGSPLEPRIGFSRAVRAGRHVAVAGTAPIGDDGLTVGPGDVYAQTVRCLDIAERALREAGASVEDVVRTRVLLTDVTRWEEAARAHGERFAEVRPACTEGAGRHRHGVTAAPMAGTVERTAGPGGPALHCRAQ